MIMLGDGEMLKEVDNGISNKSTSFDIAFVFTFVGIQSEMKINGKVVWDFMLIGNCSE